MNLKTLRFSVCLMLCLGTLGTALADSSLKVDIPAGDLKAALDELSKQSGADLVYRPEQVKGLRTHGAHGALSVAAAVQKLLEGTGLEVSTDSSGAMLIAQPKRPAAGVVSSDLTSAEQLSSNKEGKKASSQDFRVAQVDQNAAGPPAVDKGKEEEAANKKKTAGLEEIVVTGSRIPTAAGQQTLPVRSYTREDIEHSGQSTIAQYLDTLPDVSTFQTGIVSLGFAGVQAVQLHGLPAGTTLTLLDGRRLESGAVGFFDVGDIPTSAVERIEILPVGASSVYGADALGGAVNFILRKNFTGFEINASLDHAPDVNNPGVNLAWGKAWDRASVSLIASYDHRGELLGTQREPSSSTQLPSFVSAAQAMSLFSDSCSPGNVYSLDGSNLPGLSSPYAAIPAGITGKPTISQFLPTAGKLNVCNGFKYLDITPKSDRASVLLSAHYDVSDALDVFSQVLYSQNHQRIHYGANIVAYASFGSTLAASNPYNPFGEDVGISYEDPTSLQTQEQLVSFISPTIGLRGNFLSDWKYEATATWSRDRLENSSTYADFGAVGSALASSDAATALNPFTTGPSGSPQLINSLTGPNADLSEIELEDRTLSTEIVAHGPLLHLPAGPLQAVLGAQYTREEQDSTSAGTGFSIVSQLHRNSYGLFGEIRAPLLAGSAPTQDSERLSLTAAARFDHSDDYGGKATWQGGAQWRVTDTLSLSGGYGKSYAAPHLSQISGPLITSQSILYVVDPYQGNQLATYPVNVASGANSNLKAETGDSSMFTMAYSRDPQRGLRASLTWYAINISNYITAPSPQVLIDNPSLYPGAVTRAPPTAQDQQLGYLGQIVQLNQTDYNYGEVHLAGVNADLSYALETPLGRFTPALAIAEIYKWTSSLVPGSPTINGVSQATLSGVGWAPRWKGTASVAWNRGPLSTNFAGRYIGRYRDYRDDVPNNNEIGNSWIFDASVRWELKSALAPTSQPLAHSYISLAAVNVFNKLPPFSFNPEWYDYQEYDIRGRYLRLIVGTRF